MRMKIKKIRKTFVLIQLTFGMIVESKIIKIKFFSLKQKSQQILNSNTNSNPKSDLSTLNSTIKNKNFSDSNFLKKNYENPSGGAYSNFTNKFQLLQEMEFASGEKDDDNYNYIKNIGTPAFYMENSVLSSRKNNKSSSNKKVEFRYTAEDELTNKINNINFKNFGNFQITNDNCIAENNNNTYDKSILNNSLYSKNYLNTEYNFKPSSNSCINQKLNFEIICENYQNGKIFNNLFIIIINS